MTDDIELEDGEDLGPDDPDEDALDSLEVPNDEITEEDL